MYCAFLFRINQLQRRLEDENNAKHRVENLFEVSAIHVAATVEKRYLKLVMSNLERVPWRRIA